MEKNSPDIKEAPQPAGDSALAGSSDTELEKARAGLHKLPILGPALWLYGRDPQRKFTFIADIDWQLLPPVVLDQCQLFTKSEIPTAFYTWAFVSDDIDARLRSGVPRLAPHEWKSGPHLWFIDMVSPFSSGEDTVTTLLTGLLSGHRASALVPNVAHAGQLHVRNWEAQQKMHPPASPVASE